jgi:large subunit ribosomal protein L25
MRSVDLNVSIRKEGGSVRRDRRDGLLPGVFYGVGGENLNVAVELREFERAGLASRGAHLIRFVSADEALDKSVALIREVQAHPVSGKAMHVDFLRLDLAKPVQTSVALSFVGKAEGVIAGGILQPIRRELEVKALPDKLPEAIEVDVAALGIHDSIHVEDLVLGEGVESLHSENFTVVTVVPPVVEKVEEPEVEEELAEGEAVVEGEESAQEDGTAEKESAPDKDAGS